MAQPVPMPEAGIEVKYSEEKKELRLAPTQIKKCVTLYDRTTRWFRSTEYVWYHFDGKKMHIVFLRSP